MSFRSDSFGQAYARWRDANAAAFAAAEKVLAARKRWERGLGELPTDQEVEEANRLRDLADGLLRAASEEQATRPAPL